MVVGVIWGVPVSPAHGQTLGYDAVDTSREMDYAITGWTKYDYAIQWAYEHWDSFGRVNIVNHGAIYPPTPLPNDIDVGIEDYWSNAAGAPRGYWQSSNIAASRMRFNQYELDASYSYPDLNRGTGAHEFGHALGLAHSWMPNLMHGSAEFTRCISPCANDVAVYQQLWPALANRQPEPERAPTGPSVVHFEYGYDAASPRVLRQRVENVFLGRVIATLSSDTVQIKPNLAGVLTRSLEGLPHTSYQVSVTRRLKGTVGRQTVLRQVGGIDLGAGEEVYAEHGTPLEVGQTRLFFTSRDPATGTQTVVAPGHGDRLVSTSQAADRLIAATMQDR